MVTGRAGGPRRLILTAATVQDQNGINEMVTLTVAAMDTITAENATERTSVATVTVLDMQRPTVEFKEEDATFLEATKATITLTASLGNTFDHNMKATVNVDEMSRGGVSKVQLLGGAGYDADGRLIVDFADATKGGTEITFEVQALTDSDGRNEEVTLMLSKPGDGVRLGAMTSMTLMIIDDDEDDGTPPPTKTPALPIFGAFALGAGLLAAGRARLRRREQRQLTR